jgi:hypothetical protein
VSRRPQASVAAAATGICCCGEPSTRSQPPYGRGDGLVAVQELVVELREVAVTGAARHGQKEVSISFSPMGSRLNGRNLNLNVPACPNPLHFQFSDFQICLRVLATTSSCSFIPQLSSPPHHNVLGF